MLGLRWLRPIDEFSNFPPLTMSGDFLQSLNSLEKCHFQFFETQILLPCPLTQCRKEKWVEIVNLPIKIFLGNCFSFH